MVQRILQKMAKAKIDHKSDAASRGEAEHDDPRIDTHVRESHIESKACQQHVPANAARANLKHDLLAAAAKARDRACNNSDGRIHKVNDCDRKGKGREEKHEVKGRVLT